MKLFCLSILITIGIVATLNLPQRTDFPINGVHSGRVFKFKPELKWQFNASDIYTNGFLSLDEEGQSLYFPHSATVAPAGSPNIVQVAYNGTLLNTFNISGALASGVGSVAYRDGTIYAFNSDQTLTAFDRTTKEVKWQTNFPKPSTFSTFSPILFSKDGSRLYFMGLIGAFVARTNDGAILQNATLPVSDIFNALVPFVPVDADQTIIWQWNTGVISKFNDSATFEQQWSYQFPSETKNSAPPAPIVNSKGDLFALSAAGEMIALDKDGGYLWGDISIPDRSFSNAGPVLINDNYFIAGDDSYGEFYTVSTANGTITLSYDSAGTETEFLGITSTILWNNNVLYAMHDVYLVAYDTTNPLSLKRLWIYDTGLYVEGGGIAIAKDGTIFVPTANRNINKAPVLVALGCPNGKIVDAAGEQCICKAGLVLNNNTKQCDQCEEGTFSNEGDTACKPCSQEPNNLQCATEPVATPVNVGSPVAAPTSVTAPKGKLSGGSVVIGTIGTCVLIIMTLLF